MTTYAELVQEILETRKAAIALCQGLNPEKPPSFGEIWDLRDKLLSFLHKYEGRNRTWGKPIQNDSALESLRAATADLLSAIHFAPSAPPTMVAQAEKRAIAVMESLGLSFQRGYLSARFSEPGAELPDTARMYSPLSEPFTQDTPMVYLPEFNNETRRRILELERKLVNVTTLVRDGPFKSLLGRLASCEARLDAIDSVGKH